MSADLGRQQRVVMARTQPALTGLIERRRVTANRKLVALFLSRRLFYSAAPGIILLPVDLVD